MEFRLQVTVPDEKLNDFDMVAGTLETVVITDSQPGDVAGLEIYTVEGSPADLLYLAKKLEVM